MATSSILGGTRLPEEISGKDLQTLGPSDNSDSGSDAVGAYGDDAMSGDSDAAGTGERASADGENNQADADIRPDHVEKIASVDPDMDLDGEAGDDFNDPGEAEELAGDGDELDAELNGEDDDELDNEDDAGPGIPSPS